MNKDDFLKKIKEEKPISKWVFLLKHIFVWLSFILFILVGIISTSLIIHSIFNSGFDLDKTSLNNELKLIFNSLPYLWIISTSIFFALSYFNFKNTDNGYKYLNIKNILIVLFGSIVIGIFFYNIGFAKFLDSNLQSSIPFYKKYINRHIDSIWNNPRSGFIAGKINEIKSGNEIVIKSYNNKEWVILLDNKTIVKHRVNMSINSGIKVIGKIIKNNIFKADEIRPEFGKGMKMDNIKK